jgi:branched-chain amino acid transport system substrate-binding protein
VLRDSYGDDADLVRVMGRLRASGADAVYAPADSADAARIAVALKQARVAAQVLGSDGWSSAEVRRVALDAVTGVVFTDAFTYATTRPEVETFVTAFRERFRAQPGSMAALGYDAARWVLIAASRTRQLDANSLRETLPTVRMEDAVANGFSMDARRNLSRGVCVLRHGHDGVELLGTMTP